MEFTKEQIDEIMARIDAELRKQGISRLRFYNESGVSSSSYSQWKTGLRNPSVGSIQKIASFLNVPVDYLLTGNTAFYPDDNDTVELRQMLVDRPEAKILFQASKNAPTSAILEAAALLMRYKEESEKN